MAGNPDTLDEAIRLHQSGQLDQAATRYRSILASQPDQSDALHLLGVLAQQQGRTAEAIDLIERALRLQPSNAVYHSNLGLALRAAGRQAEAAEHLRTAVAIDPNYPAARKNLATVLQEGGMLEEACKHLQFLRQRNASDPWPWRRLGLAQFMQGRLAEAEQTLRTAVQLQPADMDALNNLGVALKDLGRLVEAEEFLRRALAIKPDAADVRNNLGLVCLGLGRLGEAEQHFRQALRIEPRSARTLSNLAVALKQGGLVGEAEQLLRQAQGLDPREVSVLTNLGDLLNDQGKPAEALGYLQEAVRLDPRCAQAHNNLAVALKELDRPQEAAPHLDRALQLKPDYTPALNNLGNALVSRGQVAAGIEQFLRVLELEPNNIPAWYSLATNTNHRFLGADIDRLRALLRQPGLRPEWEELLHFALATVLDKQGAADEAFAHALEANRRKKAGYRRRGMDFDRRRHRHLVEDLQDVFRAETFARLPSSGLDSEVPVFVFGMPRSGTTLVEQILASHPRVFGAGELDDMLHLVAELDRGVPGLSYPRCLDRLDAGRIRQFADRQLDRLRLRGGDAARIIDKTTVNFLHLGLIVLLFPKARLIHCRRDPRDTCLSCFFHNFASSGLNFTFDLADLGFCYHDYERLMAHWRQVLPAPIFDIPYEELVGDQERWTRDLLDFCGLEWDARCLEFHRTDRPVKTASAQQVRQPMYTKSIGRWRAYAQQLQPLLDALRQDEPMADDPGARVAEPAPLAPDAPPPQSWESEGLLRRGIHLHQAGQLAAARECYDQLLRRHPEHPEALHLVGVLEHQAGRSLASLDFIHRAIAVKGDEASYHSNLALVLRALQRPAEAVAALERALELNPEYAVACKNLAVLHEEAGRNDQAEACWRRLLERQPREAGHWRGLGAALAKQNRHAEAADACRQGLTLEPGNADLHNNFGVALKELNQPEESEASYRTALRLRPDFAEGHNNLGILLADLERHSEALACFDEALRLRPDYPDARHNRGAALAALHRHEEAVADCQAALALKADEAEYHNSLGASLQALGRVDEALACYEEALRLNPEHGWAHFNRSQAWLLRGDWDRGWREWEWRWRRPGGPVRNVPIPQWDGAALPGGTVLLYAEQGLGDTFQFIRFVRQVKERVGRVIVECQEALAPLLRLCPEIDQVVARGQPLPPADAQAALLSLPGLFHVQPAGIPGTVPYLRADPKLVAYWRERLAVYPGRKVGIAWQGNPKYKRDCFRSLPLAEFAALADVPGIQFISLQKGSGREQLAASGRQPTFPVLDLGAEVDEAAGAFMDTAAIMLNLDLVITSDTSIPHLAGAMGVPVWLAVPHAPDWRWGQEGEASPWYPTMRLFRQPRLGDWTKVFCQLRTELERWQQQRPAIWIEVSPGELLDRIAYLQARLTRDPAPAIQRELAALERARDLTLAGSDARHAAADRLRTLHERLAEIEEALRGCAERGDSGAALLALVRELAAITKERADKRQSPER